MLLKVSEAYQLQACYSKITYNRSVLLTLFMKVQLNIKIEQKDLKLIRRISEKRGESLADFVRFAIKMELARLGFLNSDETKALGVTL